MVTSGSVLSIVSLFFSNSVLDNQTTYEPKHLQSSFYFHENSSATNTQFATEAVNGTFFPKCCPSGFLYETDNRECLESKNASSINKELNLKVDLIQTGLAYCPVVIDRFVEKNNLRRFTGNGNLVVENEVFPLGNYCLDNTVQDNKIYVVRLCQKKEYCLDSNHDDVKDWCVHKCCSDGFSLEDYKCVLKPNIGLHVKQNRNYYENIDGYGIHYSTEMKCSVANWYEFQELSFKIKTDGTLFENDSAMEYKAAEYCLDTMYNSDTDRLTDMIILCEFNRGLYVKWAIIRVVVIITCLCFVVTIVVCCIQKPVVTCFCFIDLIFWIMYALRIFYVDFGSFCTIFGYMYFFIMVSRLSWLNVLSYEIWMTIGNPKGNYANTMQIMIKKMLYYGVYAIAVPTIATAAFIMGHQKVHPLPESVRPRMDVSSCAIDVTVSDYYYGHIYLDIPVTVLVIINIVLFLSTLHNFLKMRRNIKTISDTTSYHMQKLVRRNKRKGIVILKLGLVMGVTWMYYLFTYLNNLEKHPVLQTIADILIFFNLFEGIYFFIIFAVKWKTIKEIPYKLKILKRDTSTDVQDSISIESLNGIHMHSFK